MDSTHAPTHTRRRRRRVVGLVFVVATVATIGAASFSLAIFTSSTSVAANAFTTGTIVLGVAPASAIFTSAAMMPGDAVPAGVPGAAVTVSNTGTGALRYAISGTSTDADSKHLNTQLLITVRQPDGNAGSSCALMTGNSLFSAVVPTAGLNMVGDPTQGNQAGDRTLAAGTNETLCFKASLPLGTTNAFQGATSTYTFTFAAEQTANNP
jgi:spore coat-associated protein N